MCFFENFDLYYKNEYKKNFCIKMDNMINLYYNYKDELFKDNAISFEIEFFNKKRFNNQIEDLDLLIHIFNTHQWPAYFEIHPISKYLFGYRNKLVNFLSTINYFIYAYEPNGRTITGISEIIIKLLRNTFPNGYVLQYNSGFLISTFIFKGEFELQQENLVDFFHLMNLEIIIYTNLNLVPISFYQLPNSKYFDNESGTWNLPFYKDQEVTHLMRYQLENYEEEKKRGKNNQFDNRVKNYLENWKREIQFLKE